MKKLLLILLGIVVLLVVVVLVGPSLIDLRPRIAAAVKDATGRELRIDGPLDVSLFPKLRVRASGIHLANAPGAAAPEMVSVDSVALDAEIWPLLGGRLVINSLVIRKPTVALEVDKAGRPNWMFQPPGKAEAPPPPRPAEGGSALGGLSLGDVKIEQGHVSYRDDRTGQVIEARDITLGAALAALDSPLTLQGRMTLNDRPVTAALSVDTLGKLQAGQQAAVKLALDTRDLTAKFDGAAQKRPVPGLNGVFDLDVPSVGRLAAWLKQPLKAGQPDPGPVKMHAVFATQGTRSELKEATVIGTGLNIKASGSVEATATATKIVATVDSGLIDLDRYLPPPPPAPPAGAKPAPPPPHRPAMGGKGGMVGLSDKPFDLSALRKLDADVKLSVAGIKAMGFEAGRLAFNTVAKDGVLTADFSEAALYGGTVKGTIKLDGAGKALDANAAVKIDRVAVDRLAALAGPDAAPVAGVASATLDAKGQGISPRALAEDLSGRLTADLGGVTVKAAGAPKISRLDLALDLPGGDKAVSLVAGAVYNGERVDAKANLGPLRALVAGERFPARLAVDSKLLTLRYDGAVQQKPIPGLDGTFDLDIPSVARAAAWMGKPLDGGQPDPGPLKLHAVMASDGAKLALKDATITGKAIEATAQGSFDGGAAPPTFDARIDVRQADLNAYLPPPAKKPAAPARPAAAAEAGQTAGWSTEPFDLSALGAANGKAVVNLAAVRYGELDITKGAITLNLANRVLKLAADKLALAKGTVDGGTILDGSGGRLTLDVQAKVAGVEAKPLLETFAGSDRLGGTVEFATAIKGAGHTEKELVSSLDGQGQVTITDGAIYGINLAQTLRKVGTVGLGDSKTEKTDFAELSGTYTIKSGVIDNRDMKMLAPLVRLSGSGTVPMPPRTVDYAVEAKLVPTIKGQGGQDALAGLPIPIKIAGPWSGPSYTVDWRSVFKAISADPARLKNMPADLGKAAKDFGVSLPGVGGTGVPGKILQGIPGLPQAPAPSTQPAAPEQEKKAPSLPFSVPKNLFGK